MTASGRPGTPGSADDGAERERFQRIDSNYGSSSYYSRIWRSGSLASRLMRERKWELVEDVIRKSGLDLSSARILDLGVGSGADGGRFKALNIRADRFVGLDFLEGRLREALRNNPWMGGVVGDACLLPFPARHFDLVFQSTMLSSIPQEARRARVFREIDRVLAPGGMFLSYDTRYPNPWNPNTRPVRVNAVRHALPGWRVEAWSATLIPQLQRLLAPMSVAACRSFERIPFLRSHLVVLARKTS